MSRTLETGAAGTVNHQRKPLETESSSGALPDWPSSDQASFVSSEESVGLFHSDESIHNESIPETDSSIPSNERLLGTAFVSFMSFALVQMVFAFVADSEAMKGDSAAMIVDALTYLFNWIAEHRKNHFDWNVHANSDRMRRRRKRAYRKMVLQMEILPPLLSVTTLLFVTVIVTYQAVLVLMGLHNPARSAQQPNLHLMMGFSIFNLGLDGLNVFCFARAKHLFGYETMTKEKQQQQQSTEIGASPRGYALATEDTSSSEHNSSHLPSSRDDSENDDTDEDDDDHTNLNMCSAYTHVFADTLRSFAVIIAAVTAEVVSTVTPQEADATAAIVVSVLIALSLIPLFQGLASSLSELKGIYAEEKSELLEQQTWDRESVIT